MLLTSASHNVEGPLRSTLCHGCARLCVAWRSASRSLPRSGRLARRTITSPSGSTSSTTCTASSRPDSPTCPVRRLRMVGRFWLCAYEIDTHTAPNMTHGKVFIRSGFESTLEVCNVTLQPMFPDCGRSLEAAKAIARQVRIQRQRPHPTRNDRTARLSLLTTVSVL